MKFKKEKQLKTINGRPAEELKGCKKVKLEKGQTFTIGRTKITSKDIVRGGGVYQDGNRFFWSEVLKTKKNVYQLEPVD